MFAGGRSQELQGQPVEAAPLILIGSRALFLTGYTGGYRELDRHSLRGVVGSGDGEGHVEFSGWRQTWGSGAAGAGAAPTASADNHGTTKQQATPYEDGK